MTNTFPTLAFSPTFTCELTAAAFGCGAAGLGMGCCCCACGGVGKGVFGCGATGLSIGCFACGGVGGGDVVGCGAAGLGRVFCFAGAGTASGDCLTSTCVVCSARLGFPAGLSCCELDVFEAELLFASVFAGASVSA